MGNDQPQAGGAGEHARQQHPGTKLRGSLDALARMSTAQSGLRDTLTHVAARAVRSLPGADGAGLTVFTPDRPDVLVASAPFVSQVDQAQYGIGEGPCITAALEATALRCPSLGKDPRWPEFGRAATQLDVHSSLSLPLLTPDGVLGTLNVYAHRKHAFSRGSLHDGEQYAVSATTAVVSASQLQAAQSRAGTLSEALGMVMRGRGVSAVEAFALLEQLGRSEKTELAVLARLVVDGTVSLDQLGSSGTD